jgi:DNA-binding response OmpR family regulator
MPAPVVAEPAGRLLVVDDEVDVRELVGLAAEACGWTCDGAGSVAEVDRRLPGAYDLVLVDLVLGDEDGASVLELLARTGSGAQVLLMSGGTDHRFDVAASAARGDGLHVAGSLHKPFRLAELRALLAERSG